jgi:hypothetical protein
MVQQDLKNTSKNALALLQQAIRIVFYYSFFFYIGLFVIDDISGGAITRVFTMNGILLVVVLSFFFSLPSLMTGIEQRQRSTESRSTLWARLAVAVIGVTILAIRLRQLGIVGYLVSLAIGIAVFIGLKELVDQKDVTNHAS